MLIIGDSTRYFTVVGAPYVPEHHDEADGNLEPCVLPHIVNHTTIRPDIGTAGWWLRDDD